MNEGRLIPHFYYTLSHAFGHLKKYSKSTGTYYLGGVTLYPLDRRVSVQEMIGKYFNADDILICGLREFIY